MEEPGTEIERAELAHDEELVARFRREALAAARLSHPNILHIYDASSAEGAYDIVKDYALREPQSTQRPLVGHLDQRG